MKSDICVFCEASNLKVLVPARVLPDEVNVLQCRDCDLVFLESRNGVSRLDQEETAYWDGEEQKRIYLESKIQETFVKEFEKRLAFLERYTRGAGKLLDVGCGIGHFLYTARKRGWEVQGIDISQAASQAAQDAYGLEVQVGTLENASFSRAQFDAITLWDVIEHIRRPLQNLKAVNQFLRMGGFLVMKTPNEASFFKQFARACFKFFGEKGNFLLKYVYYVPHYFSYSEKTMAKLLALSGFEMVKCELDETPFEFAVEKIHTHYAKDPKRKLVIALLGIGQAIARLLKRHNKIVVYARKVREAETNG